MKKFIMKALALSEEAYDQIEEIKSLEDFNLELTLKKKVHYCPKCDKETMYVKGYTKRKISHSFLLNRETTFFYNCRRYLCKHCRASFTESNPFTLKDQTKISSYSIINILNDLRPYNATFSDVARRYHISVSKVIDVFDSYVQIPRKKLSRIICLDEFYFNRHSKYKYAFMIMDFEKKIILDILESRHTQFLNSYFYSIPREERNNVDYVIIDMYKNYCDLAGIFFKEASVCVDPFHAVKKINDSLNIVRKRIMRKYNDNHDSKEYKLLKYRYKIILKNRDNINSDAFYYDRVLGFHTNENRVLEEILKIDVDLRVAYQLKEMYIQFNDQEELTYNAKKTRIQLESIIEAMETSDIKEFTYCANTLMNWKKEILNSFVWINGRRLSNGPIEGKNNYVKKILSNANGFRNFDRARNRIMFSQNQFEKFSLTKHKKEIKKPGKKRGKYKKKNQKD